MGGWVSWSSRYWASCTLWLIVLGAWYLSVSIVNQRKCEHKILCMVKIWKTSSLLVLFINSRNSSWYAYISHICYQEILAKFWTSASFHKEQHFYEQTEEFWPKIGALCFISSRKNKNLSCLHVFAFVLEKEKQFLPCSLLPHEIQWISKSGHVFFFFLPNPVYTVNVMLIPRELDMTESHPGVNWTT